MDVELEVWRVRQCISPPFHLDMWTETPVGELARCLDQSQGCPVGSNLTASSGQCASPDVYGSQLRLNFRLALVCTTTLSLCNGLPGLTSADEPGSPAVVAAVRLKLAQCLRLDWHEVRGGILVWTTSHQLRDFKYEEGRRLGELPRRLGVAVPCPWNVSMQPRLGRRLCERSLSFRRTAADPVLTPQAEFAWQVVTSRLSLSEPIGALRSILNGDGSSLSLCLGLNVQVLGVESELVANASDPSLVPMNLTPTFRFEGFQWDEQAWGSGSIPSSPSMQPSPMQSNSSSQSSAPTPSPSLSVAAPSPSQALGSAPAPTMVPPLYATKTKSDDVMDSEMFYVLLIVVPSLVILTACAVFFKFYCARALVREGQPATGEAWSAATSPREAWAAPGEHMGPPPYTMGSVGRGHGSPGMSSSRSNATGSEAAKTPHATQAPPAPPGPPPPEPVHFIVKSDSSFFEAKNALAKELEHSVASETLDVRRRRFKELCLQLHPDKNGGSEESNSIFQFLQAQRERYLADGS